MATKTKSELAKLDIDHKHQTQLEVCCSITPFCNVEHLCHLGCFIYMYVDNLLQTIDMKDIL